MERNRLSFGEILSLFKKIKEKIKTVDQLQTESHYFLYLSLMNPSIILIFSGTILKGKLFFVAV